ncbi:MAG: hypothetical protein LBS68_01620 [Puniceicoccales bacterium]|nr:hypothetical protein [Puniceicoccales bacterium]
MSTENVSKSETVGETSWVDRTFLFVCAHRRIFLRTLILVLFLLLGVGGSAHWKKYRMGRMQEKFLAALESPDALQRFAGHYRTKPLGALAAYMLGNRALRMGEFAAAAHHFFAASGILSNTEFDGVATLAAAVASIRDGETQWAREKLTRLASDEDQISVVRAGAVYMQALLAYEEGDLESARTSADSIAHLPSSGIWGTKAAILAAALR